MMRRIAKNFLFLQIIGSALYCASFYWLGFAETVAAMNATNPYWLLGVGLFVFVALFFLFVSSLFRGRNRLWMRCALVGFFGFFLLPLELHLFHGLLVAKGLRQRMMRDFGAPELRLCVRDIADTLPADDRFQGYYCYQGNFMDLPVEEQAPYEKLTNKYPFLKWNADGSSGPTVFHHQQIVNVYWNGWFGKWGFSVDLTGKKNVPDPWYMTERVSDDIYFYADMN